MRRNYQARYKKGERIGGRYLVHQALLGGMGEVYLCLDEEENNPLALKTFQGSDLRMKALFETEVASWIALEKHPNIVRLFYTKTLDNIPFMLLEWVASSEIRGTDLRSWLRNGALDIPLALKFTIDIVRGLQHANEKSPGIVHRDLKPDNVLVNQSRQAKITDFGLAIVVQESNLDIQAGETGEVSMGQNMRVGNVVGTPAYMPPEQWRGETELDFRTDLYAVGCILYELLTGKWLYDGRTINELKAQHLEEPPPALSNDFPPELNQILQGCLAKIREDRFERIELLLTTLIRLYQAYSDEPLPDINSEEFTVSDYNNRGTSYSDLGQYQRAIADYDEAIRLDPDSAQIYSNRGTSYSDLGQHERAIQDHDQAIQLNPDYATAYYNRGNSYISLGQHERAIQDFDQAIQLDPKLAQAYSNRGASYTSLGQHERAIQDHDQAIQLNPNDATAYSNRGNSYGPLGQHERAIQDYDQAIRLDPNYATAYYNRGIRYTSLGQHERAIQNHDQAIRLDPNYAKAYSNRGTSYGFLDQHERAIQDHDQAIRLDPNYVTAYYNRGLRYGELGQHQHAIKDYDEAIRLDPNFAIAYYARGNSYNDLGQHERAIQDYDQAIRFDPNYATAYINKGVALANNGRLPEALACFDKAVELGDVAGVQYATRVRQIMKQTPTQINPNDPQAAFEAFQQANSLNAMRQAIQQYPILTEGIAKIEQVINEQVPAEAKPAMEQKLAWLKQIIQQLQTQQMQQLVALYREQGEVAFKQVLAQQDAPAAQIDELVRVVKRMIAGGE